VTIYADKFYTYEDQVLTALRSLRQRQVEASFDDSAPQVYTCNFLQPTCILFIFLFWSEGVQCKYEELPSGLCFA